MNQIKYFFIGNYVYVLACKEQGNNSREHRAEVEQNK